MERTVYTKFRAKSNYSEEVVDRETEISKRIFEDATSECSHQWYYVALKHIASRAAFSTASAKGSGGIQSLWLLFVLRDSETAKDFCSIPNFKEVWRDIIVAYDSDSTAVTSVLDTYFDEDDLNFEGFWEKNSETILALKGSVPEE